MESSDLNTQGSFLLSLPNMHDSNFRNSLVYISDHSGDGAKGWVINKEVEPRIAVKLRKSIQLGVVCPLYYGGPVDITQVYVLHSSETQIKDNTVVLNDNLCMTRDKKMIQMLNNNEFPNFWRVSDSHKCSSPSEVNITNSSLGRLSLTTCQAVRIVYRLPSLLTITPEP